MKVEIIEHLRKLGRREIEPINTTAGICEELRDLFKVAYYHTINTAKKWLWHSGDSGFPVPSPGKDPEDKYFDTPDKWSGSYGERRRELCLFLADEWEKEWYKGNKTWSK
jgi:hypothetical protein